MENVQKDIEDIEDTHIGDGAFGDEVEIKRENLYTIKIIDGIATEIINSRIFKNWTVYKAKYFNKQKSCFVAKRGEYYAHGETVSEAISDVNFKYLQQTADIQEIIENIKKKRTVTIEEYRLITGACSMG